MYTGRGRESTGRLTRYSVGTRRWWRTRRGGTGLADATGDVVQETFLRVYQRLWELHDPEKFVPWLRTIVRRVCLGELRSQYRAQRTPLGEVGEREEPPLAREDLYHVLRALPGEDREPLRLHYLLDLDTHTAARVMGVSGELSVCAFIARDFGPGRWPPPPTERRC